jgi:hypothetical protein
MVKRLHKNNNRKGQRISRMRNRQVGPNKITFSGRVGLFTAATASTTYWMTPNSSFSSAWLGFTPVVAGIFGNNANNLAHCFKQFRIKRLMLEMPPQTGINQICAYTSNVGYLATTLSFPNVMEYPCAEYSGLGETVTKRMEVPRSVLQSGQIKWYSTEANPGTGSTDPASDPNVSSHGLLIITDGSSAGYPYILHFTLEFRDSESLTQINPGPFQPLQITHDKKDKDGDVIMKEVDHPLRQATDSLPIVSL